VDQGTLSSSGNYRSFPAIAPNACGDLAVGYTRMNTSSFPSVYIAGREAGDPAGQLKNETLVHAGEATYTAYDTAPRRWGDYTGMGIDPDGVTFWYVGEYSRNQATARWSTWISAATFPGCSVGPTPTPGPTATATNTPLPTNTPGPTSCTVYNSTDVPKSISTSGTPSISSVLNVPTSGTIVDVNVLNLNGTHTYINDLDFNLTSPLGTEVQIMARSCSSQDNFNLSLDDEAAPGSWPCPPVGGGTYQPSNALSAYDGQNRAGTWTLRIDDNANLDGGSLNGWGLEICVAGGGPTATNTPAPPTATNTAVPPTATNTPAPPTATNTAVPPTATNTAVPPTPTSTATPPTGGTIFFDNFETNLGWTVNPSGSDSATTGQWQRANPEQTTSGSTTLQLGTTVSGNNDLVTGSLAGSSAGANDIDGGTTSIRSPNIVLPSSGNITLSFSYYLAHLNNATNVDFLRVSVVGSSTSLVLEELGSADNDSAVWDSFSTNLNSFAGQTVYLLIQAADAGGGSLVEAGIDDVRIEVGTTSSCVTYTSSNVPISLPNGTSSISSNLTVSGATSIGDLNLSVDMAHVWVGDLSMVLTHQSTGTSVTVLDRPGVPASTYGCSGDNILATLDDEAAVPVENQCGGSVPTINGTFSPNNALSAFDGQSGNGTWVLQVIDNYTASDAGTLNGWSIEVCSP
jgi:subtilisin-like proprotein convertase family protein